jgi:hypothetical protein
MLPEPSATQSISAADGLLQTLSLWERPEELINTIWDDLLLELFIEEHGMVLPRVQAEAATALRDELNKYCEATPKNLDPEQVLADPR